MDDSGCPILRCSQLAPTGYRSVRSGHVLPTLFVVRGSRRFGTQGRTMGEGGTKGASEMTTAKTVARAGGSTAGRLADIRPEIESIAEASGCELWHAELKGGTLRLFLDKPEGVTLSDCEHVSKLVSAYL